MNGSSNEPIPVAQMHQKDKATGAYVNSISTLPLITPERNRTCMWVSNLLKAWHGGRELVVVLPSDASDLPRLVCLHQRCHDVIEGMNKNQERQQEQERIFRPQYNEHKLQVYYIYINSIKYKLYIYIYIYIYI